MNNTFTIDKDTYFVFSGGEVHVKLPAIPPVGPVKLVLRDYTSNGIVAMFQLTQILREAGFGEIHAVVPYIPYARQDRWTTKYEPFSLKVFAAMLNAQNYKTVTMYDPHSDVSPALINHSRIVPQETLVGKAVPKEMLERVLTKELILVSPDAGAFKKVSKLTDRPVAIGVKVRCVTTGEITRTDVSYDKDLTGKDCLMVDDICDGGRTFIELAKALRAKGAAKVYLYVTHGIFSNGFEELEKHIDYIYTTNTFRPHYNDHVKIAWCERVVS